MGMKKTPLRINIRQNQNVSSRSYGHWFAEVDNLGWLSTKALCDHIAEHGRIWTEDIVRGVLSQLAECIPELVGQGYGVKLDGLGTFLPFAHSEGVSREKLLSDGYNPVLYVKGVAIRFIPDGSEADNLTSKAFKQYCSLEAGDAIKTVSVGEGDEKKTYHLKMPIEELVAGKPWPTVEEDEP